MLFYCQFDRAVVRTEDFGVDSGSFQTVAKTVAYDEVVDAPARILLSGLEPV